MYRSRFIVFAAMLLCLFGLQVASAQGTAAKVTVVSGNGQIFCSCPLAGGLVTGYNPLVVKVTDAAGNPVSGATVNWGVVVSNVTGFGNMQFDTTTTGADGTTSNNFLPQGAGGGTINTPPTQFQITATSGSGSATFSLVQAYTASGGQGQIAADTSKLPLASDPSNPITAISGQQGFTYNNQSGQSFTIGLITNGGTPVVGASVRIANFQGSPTATCVTGPGADPGSVLTDSTGYATCTPVFSGSGSGSLILVIGGVVDPANPGPGINNLLTYYLRIPPNTQFQVTPATPSSLQVVSGTGQSASAGSAVTAPLVAVVNAQGGGTLSGQSVSWSVSPAGSATLANTTTTSDINGNVSNTVTLSSTASGTVTVTATMTNTPTLKTTFTINAIPVVTLGGMVKVSGDNQTAVVSTAFAPVVVQVNNAAGAGVANIPVTFTATGGATLSTSSTTTGSNGQASVTVTAGANPGPVSVTASGAGFSQTFNLTVSPPGPVFNTNSFRNAADQQVNSISPCSLATVYATGVAPGISGISTGNMFGLGALSPSLANTTVLFGNTAAPILNIATINNQQQITFEVPCDVLPGSNQVTINVGAGTATTPVNVLPASPGVFLTGNSLTLASGGNAPLAVFIRPDGSFVTQANAARKGETITAYVTGLGPATPSVVTNAVPLPTAISTANNTVIVGIANAGVPLVSAQLSPDLVGIYRVSFQVPNSAPSGNQVFSIGATFGGKTYYSAGAAIPIQ